MNEEHGILEQVYAAKESVQAADQLIGDYLPSSGRRRRNF